MAVDPMLAVGVVVAAAMISLLAASRNPDSTKQVLKGARLVRTAYLALVIGAALVVFILSGSPILIGFAALIVVLVALHAYFRFVEDESVAV